MRPVSIIIPVIREDKVNVCLRAIKENAGNMEYEVITEVDTDRVGCPKMIKRLVEKTKFDLVMFLGDDTVPQKGFLKEAVMAMDSLPDGCGIVGLSTEERTGWNEQAHFLGHKKMLEFNNGEFYSTVYRHCYGEDELVDIAKEMGRFKYAEKAKIMHDHPINKKGDYTDKDLFRVYSDENFLHDQKLYYKRKRARMQKRSGVKLAIAVPLVDDKVYNQFLFSFVKVVTDYMMSQARKGQIADIDILFPDFPCQVDDARNNLVQQALNLGCTHILMMDSDQIYITDNIIEKMLAHDKPVLGARVHRRYPPFDPLLLMGEVSKLYQLPDDKIRNADGTFKTEVTVDFTGTGCILYDMKIFNEMIPEKWFEFKTGEQGQPVGEDIGMCEKLKKLGIPIVVDCSIDIKHLTLLAADYGTYALFKKIMS